ncbi:Smr protein/MutS2 [Salinisphaera sp. PC39]|uniref:Smr/MutS family protein n=1 Tax=Salinisphaera sp. PC39 TaxID=1304156 RepID=UPI00333F52AF
MSRDPDKPPISDEDRELFRDALGDIAPVKPGRRPPRRAPPPPRPRSTEADEAAVIEELLEGDPEEFETGDELLYRRHGIQHAVMRRLRRGHYRCQAELDLHGLFVDVARREVAAFLAEARDAGYRCVRIVHGKGLRSGNRGPVLKSKLALWLRRRDDVLAYCSARPVDGGTGAVYVLLRR